MSLLSFRRVTENEIAKKLGLEVSIIKQWLEEPSFAQELSVRQQNIKPQDSAISTTLHPEPVQNKRRRWWLIGGIGLGSICLLSAICVFVFVRAGMTLTDEQEVIAKEIDQFMKIMVERDTDSAYKMFSTFAPERFSISAIEEMIAGSNYSLFDGYKKIGIGRLNIGNYITTSSDEPSGVIANINGRITYKDGFEGSFTATLQKENERWKLISININVTPDKLEAYMEKSQSK